MRAFAAYHPVILMCYFIVNIFVTMFTLNPVLLAASLIGGVLFCGKLYGLRELLKSLALSLPMLIIVALTNPLFVHKGETILFFLNDNPVTAEAIFYGLAVAVMIFAVFYWFKCYHAVMTSDKFVFLFGRVIPKLSLLLSLILGFVPKFKRRFREIDGAQKALGIYTSKSYVDKLRSKLRVLGILVTWSLESSVQAADSMRARGYGLRGRTSYAIFRWTKRDTLMAAAAGLTAIFVIALLIAGQGAYVYYPVLSKLSFDLSTAALYVGMLLLALLPAAVELKEDIVWRCLRSKI